MLGVGLTWGAAWFAIGYATGQLVGVLDPDSMDPGETPLLVGTLIGLVGFLSGCCFAMLLSLVEGRKGILDLSVWRAALWGAVGAAAPLYLSGMPDGMVVITAPLGAAFAAGSVAMARRAARLDAALVAEAAPAELLEPGTTP